MSILTQKFAGPSVFKKALILLVVLAVGILALTFYASGKNAPSQEVSSGEGSSLLQKPEKGFREVNVFLDGWSKKTLGTTRLSYAVANESRVLGGDNSSQAVNFTAVSSQDVGAIAQTAPQILTAASSRMLSVDPTLVCTKEGCKGANGSLSLDFLTDAKAAPGYGVSYAGYGIDAGLYKARLKVPANTTSISLTAEDYTPFILSLGAVGEGNEKDGEGVAPGPQNGYGSQWQYIGAGFGRFFYPTPGWLKEAGKGADVKRFNVSSLGAKDVPQGKANAAALSGPFFIKGLSTKVPQASGLNDEQMTYMTSPSTGCGVGVVCVPEKVDTQLEKREKPQILKVCSTKKDRPGSAVLIFRTNYWKLSFSQPTHQFGVWDGKKPADFENASDKAGFFTGNPPLVTGDQDLRVSQVEMITGEDAKMWNELGYVAQVGKDAPEDFQVTFSPDQLKNYMEGTFQACAY